MTGKRGKGRLVMKTGNIFSSETNSGLERSGDVHVRMCSPSVSSKVALTGGVVDGSSSSPTALMTGLEGSPIFSEASGADTGT